MRFTCCAILILALASCEKKSESALEFKGVVIDYSTSARIPDADVRLLRIDGFTPANQYYNPLYNYSQSNTSGEYNIAVDAVSSNLFYHMDAAKPGYQVAGNICDFSFIAKAMTQGTNNYRDTVYLDKETILRIMINNIIPASPTDTLDVSISRGRGCPPVAGTFILGKYTRKEKQLYGAINAEMFTDSFSLKSYPEVTIKWTLRNNGLISSNEQVVIPTEFGTTTFNIDY